MQVMEAVQAVEAGRRNMYDPDEIEEEQRERELRNKVRDLPTLWTHAMGFPPNSTPDITEQYRAIGPA